MRGDDPGTPSPAPPEGGLGGGHAAERIRLALASAQVGVWDWNIDTGQIDWSDEAAAIFGVQPGQLAGPAGTYERLIHPDDRDRVVSAISAALARPSVGYAIEHRVLRDDGSVRWVSTRGKVHTGPDGRPLHMTGTVADVTARGRAEESLRRAEELFRAIVEDQEEMIVRWLPDGTRTFVNRAYCRTFGLRYDELIGSSFFPLISEADRARFLDKIRMLSPETPVATHTHQSVLPDGTLAWQEWTDRGRFDAQGRLIELQSVGRDVNERKRAEQSLAASEMLLRLFIKHTPAAVAMFDQQVRYLQWSDRWLKDYHLEEQDLTGRSHYEVFPNLPERWREVHRRVLQGAVERVDEDQFERADGSTEWLQWEIRPWFRVDGAIGGMIMFTQIITERKRFEEALHRSEESLRQAQKMEAIGLLAGGIAHDFNNILAAILLQAQATAREPGTNEHSRQALSHIVQAAQRAADLTRQLLQFSRRQVMQSRWVELNTAVLNLSSMLRRVLRADVELAFSPHEEPLFVFADGVMIDQVLMNLALNARDAMPDGGMLIISLARREVSAAELGAFPETAAGPHAEMTVTDTGAGIASELLPRIFEPFFTTKGPGKGTGLGLATVFGIVRQHRGAIFVSSLPGEGTTFRILLPLGEPELDELPERGSLPPPSGAPPAGRGEVILIVEDDMAVLTSMKALLEAEGYATHSAVDAREALLAWERLAGQIDLLLTDMVIPGGQTGQDLAARFQSLSPSLQVILTSGYSQDIFGRMLELRSGQSFLAKPIHADVLLETVRTRLAARRQAQGG